MNSFKVEGGVRLSGEVFPQGAKNEALQILCAVLLTPETVTVKIEINGVVYPVSCMTGEEDRLIDSSKEVNKVIASLSNVSETIGETRLLAMTSLILADKLIEQENTSENNNLNELINWLEKATERMNKVAKLLENK